MRTHTYVLPPMIPGTVLSILVMFTHSILTTTLLGTDYCHNSLLTDKETEAHACQQLAHVHSVGRCKARTTLCMWLLPCHLYGIGRSGLRHICTPCERCRLALFQVAISPSSYLYFVTYLLFTENSKPLRTTEEARQARQTSFF